jgi:hypothetical protein
MVFSLETGCYRQKLRRYQLRLALKYYTRMNFCKILLIVYRHVVIPEAKSLFTLVKI